MGPLRAAGDTARCGLCRQPPEALGTRKQHHRTARPGSPRRALIRRNEAGPRRGARTPTSVTASLTGQGRGRRPVSRSSPWGPDPGRRDRRADKGDVCGQWNVTRHSQEGSAVTCPVTCCSTDEPHGAMLSRMGRVQEGKGHRPPPEEVSKVVEIRSRKQCGEESGRPWVRDLCAMRSDGCHQGEGTQDNRTGRVKWLRRQTECYTFLFFATLKKKKE